MLQVGLLK